MSGYAWVWLAAIAVLLAAAYMVDRRERRDRAFILDELARLARLVDTDKPAPAHTHRGGEPSDSKGVEPDATAKRTNRTTASGGTAQQPRPRRRQTAR